MQSIWNLFGDWIYALKVWEWACRFQQREKMESALGRKQFDTTSISIVLFLARLLTLKTNGQTKRLLKRLKHCRQCFSNAVFAQDQFLCCFALVAEQWPQLQATATKIQASI